jgi:hypothetical protein
VQAQLLADRPTDSVSASPKAQRGRAAQEIIYFPRTKNLVTGNCIPCLFLVRSLFRFVARTQFSPPTYFQSAVYLLDVAFECAIFAVFFRVTREFGRARVRARLRPPPTSRFSPRTRLGCQIRCFRALQRTFSTGNSTTESPGVTLRQGSAPSLDGIRRCTFTKYR